MEKEIGWLLKEKYPSASLRASKAKEIHKDIERIEAGEPIDYVIGFTEFLGCRIDLSEKPLIPRPETEFWVGQAIKDTLTYSSLSGCRDSKKRIKVLDMFAGSGCIGNSILRHVKNAEVIFADKYKYFNSPNFIKSDVFSNVIGKYDYIFANPPYIPIKRKNKIQKSVLKFEPKKALFGGADGLFYIRKFLKDVNKYLNENGKIFMEFDPPQKKEIEKIIKQHKYKNYEFHKDQFSRWRWVEIT